MYNSDMNWYFLSILSLLFFGIQNFLFKVAAENKCTTKLLNLSFMLTVAVLGIVMFLTTSNNFNNVRLLLFFAIFNGLVFLFQNIFRFEALKLMPGTVAYPLFNFSNVFVIVFSFLYFQDKLNINQLAGIILGLIVLYLFSRRHEAEKVKYDRFYKGLIFILGAVVAAAFTSILSKFVAVSGFDMLLYIAVSYFYNTLFILFFIILPPKKKSSSPVLKITNQFTLAYL
jgi:drug/metabolite transporter (DMT)-like permease